MKKILLIVLTIMFVASLLFIGIGCKQETAETTAAETTATETTVAETTAAETTAAETVPEKTYADIEKNFGGQVNALLLSGYGEEGALKSFLDKYGITLNVTYFSDASEAFTKIKTSPGTYDLVTLNGFNNRQWYDAGLLEALDLNLIPNWQKMYAPFQNQMFDIPDEENKYAAPFTWGANPLHYNTDFMEKPESWWDLTDPKLKDKVGIPDAAQTMFYTAACALGLNDRCAYLTPDEFEQAKDFLRQILANSNKIAGWGDIGTMFISQDIWTSAAGWEWFTISSQAEGIPVEQTYAKEGTFSWIDCIAIVKDAPNLDNAYGFVNQYISTEAEIFWGNFLGTGVVNPEALSEIDPGLVKYFPYDDIEKFMTEIAPMVGRIPQEAGDYMTEQDWIDAWNEPKLEASS